MENISRDPRAARTDLADTESIKRVCQRVTKVRKALVQKLGLKAELLHTFSLDVTDEDPVRKPYRVIEEIGKLYSASVIMQEVKS
tara:strand:+ start:129 stop:383 length:255 start_codon:yes stop_codon:yes gene_type:complete